MSFSALLVALWNDRRKSGVSIRGSFRTCSSVSCNDEYVSTLIIENLKDRAVTIFAIYLKIGNGAYIQLENLEENPVILRPFETYKRDYGPIAFYEFNLYRLSLSALFKDDKFKKQLVLSTSGGRYNVQSYVRSWNPLITWFKNQFMLSRILCVQRTKAGT